MQRGETITEVVLAMAVVIALSPFMYNQIIEISKESQDISKANEIVNLRDNVINYVRVNQSNWDENAEIKLEGEELGKILNRFLESLSVDNRVIFLRRYWYLDTVAEIADRYGMTQSKVKTQLHRTRAKLHSFLEKEGITV